MTITVPSLNAKNIADDINDLLAEWGDEIEISDWPGFISDFISGNSPVYPGDTEEYYNFDLTDEEDNKITNEVLKYINY